MGMEIVGSAWNKVTKTGGAMVSIAVKIDGRELKLLMFKTKNKKTDKHPDWVVNLTDDAPQTQQQTPAPVIKSNNTDTDAVDTGAKPKW